MAEVSLERLGAEETCDNDARNKRLCAKKEIEKSRQA